MIALLGASAVFLTVLQAGINAPRDAFGACVKTSSAKATAEKVGGDAYEAYLRNACAAEISAYKDASIRFDVKNGASRKEAASATDDMINDWLESSIESYKYRAGASAPAKAAAAPAAPGQ